MNKYISIVALVGLLVVLGIAQDYKNRQPYPSESAWPAGIFDFTYSTTAGNQAIATRGGRFLIASNASSATITNAGVTTNAFIVAVAEQNHLTNLVESVTPAAGSFTVNTFGATTNTLGVRFLILNY